MRFLFINPNRTIAKANIWRLVNSITPPLGLATLAAVIEQFGGEADIIDAQALNLSQSELAEKLTQNGDYDYIGLTATTPEIDNAIAIASLVRRIFPKSKIIFGGVHATIFHMELLTNRYCDLVVRGEGEQAVQALAEQRAIKDIPNLSWRTDNGNIVTNPDSTAYVDLETLPFPAYHKLPMSRYRSALGAARCHPSIGMITSRGCPGACTFCFSGMFGKKIRFESAQKMILHVKLLQQKYGIREISFYDDTFTANRRRVEEFCSGLLAEGISISWSCFARVDTVTPDLLKLMQRAGCHQIMYGFETADDQVLAMINKKVASSSHKQVVAWTREAGINIRGAFMLGSPGENMASLQRTIEYSKSLGVTFAIYNITTPYPGTALYDWAQENNLLKHKEWRQYDLAHSILELPGLPSEKVENYYRSAFREFYLRPSYILRRFFSIFSAQELKMYLNVFSGLLGITLARRHNKRRDDTL